MAFYQLRNIAKVQPFLSQSDAEKYFHAFVTRTLDYCNALFTGLQRKQYILYDSYDAAAQILMKTKKGHHITPVLKELHRLPASLTLTYITERVYVL